nr:MAG TPA: hypothetical protein [Caudoviricetes sp.]DAI18269.1 MAG TPA: hypothetical protein [Caudoviricetes sp.]DAQ20792.1 MAG TPA: hypothetical protein [Caudoviricetes sp.]
MFLRSPQIEHGRSSTEHCRRNTAHGAVYPRLEVHYEYFFFLAASV